MTEQERIKRLVDLDDPEVRKLYEASLRKWDERLRPLIEANQRAEHFTAEDFNIIVGPCEDYRDEHH